MGRVVHRGPCYSLPPHALRVIRALEAAGQEAWAVGGWVRDSLLGLPSHDVDVTTSAPWQLGKQVFEASGIEVHETGTAHGTITAVIDHQPVEVTTYRTESAYTDHRHPDEVRFVRSLTEDLARRDFTINAMAFHPERGMRDPFGGAHDLSLGVVRAVGDPLKRFEEDALRVLRAVRFAARYGFVVESGTHAALSDAAHWLDTISQERVGDELNGILATGRGSWAMRDEADVLCAAIPELAPMRGFDQRTIWHKYDVWDHTMHVMAALEALSGGLARQELRWAAFLHDAAKPNCCTLDEFGTGHFYGHPEAGAELTKRVMRRLALPGEMIHPAVCLVRYHDRPVLPEARSARRLLTKFEAEDPGEGALLVRELFMLKRADALGKVTAAFTYIPVLDEIEESVRRELKAGAPLRQSDMAISGKDLIAAGVKPGPEMGRLLAKAFDAVVDNRVANERDSLLDYVLG